MEGNNQFPPITASHHSPFQTFWFFLPSLMNLVHTSSVLSNFIISLYEPSIKLVTLGTSSTAASKAPYDHQHRSTRQLSTLFSQFSKTSKLSSQIHHSERSYSSFICTDMCHDKESQTEWTKVQHCRLFYQIITSIPV